MTRQIWRERTLLVFNNNAVYCSIVFANRIENTKFVKFLLVNWMLKHLNGDWSQIAAKPTNKKPEAWLQTEESRQTQTSPDPTIGATLASFAFLAMRVANVKT
jgi:hypothetical protein